MPRSKSERPGHTMASTYDAKSTVKVTNSRGKSKTTVTKHKPGSSSTWEKIYAENPRSRVVTGDNAKLRSHPMAVSSHTSQPKSRKPTKAKGK